jgi:nitrogen fixation protein FixH
VNLVVPRVGLRPRGERRITGRMVLLALICFFAFVTLVNVVMIRAAISTFGGVDTPSSYQAGLMFKSDEADAAAQAARHWQVAASIEPNAAGAALSVTVRDGAGVPVTGAGITARLAHPIDEHRDVVVDMAEVGSGTYTGSAPVEAGQWTLDLDISKSGERLFRSRNRIVLK